MRTVFKYSFEITDSFNLNLPQSSRILSIQLPNNEPMLWALVDTEAPKVSRYFRIFGTGHLIPEDLKLKHRGTIQTGALVWHIFEDALSIQ